MICILEYKKSYCFIGTVFVDFIYSIFTFKQRSVLFYYEELFSNLSRKYNFSFGGTFGIFQLNLI